MHLGPDVASIREEEPWSKRSYICQVVLRKTRDEIWLLNLVRLNSMEQFGAAEVRILEQLEPFFDTLMQRMDAAAQSSLLGVAGWNILNSLCLGVALLESEGHIKAANSKAWAILRGRDGLEVKNDRVVATNALDNERFRNALREINTQRDISNRALIVERASSGMGLQLILVRLTPLTEWASAKGPQVALFIADPTLVNGTECLRELYGLTRVEAEIANLICRGFNPNEVADKLRMSIHTVRGYLKPMFRKMGARRQADILRIVAAGLGLVNAGTKPSEVALWRQESIVSDGLVPGLLAPGKKVAEITAERRVRTRRQMLTRTKRW
jgi:DNA-binding CsgD family transcriptional regulator